MLAENWEMAGEMRYQLGLLYIDARDTDTALGYLTEFHQYCVATNNKVSREPVDPILYKNMCTHIHTEILPVVRS